MCIILGIHGFAFLGRKTEAHSSVSQTSPGLNGKELSILDKLLSGPRSCSTVDWLRRLSGSSTRQLGATAFISPFLSQSIYKGGEDPRPDGICHTLLLLY